MKVLILSLTRPGHALDTVAEWLPTQGHEVTQIKLPSNHKKQFFFSPPEEKYDITITSEMTTALNLLLPDRKTSLGRKIFWRLDYRPRKYFRLYQVADRLISRKFDEVWSIVKPWREGEKYVPFLLSEKDFVYTDQSRKYKMVWSGPDNDNCLGKLNWNNLNLLRTDWQGPNFLSDEDLRSLWASCRVGLALYDPKLGVKKYSDPSRMKKFLACGLPVICTSATPFSIEIKGAKAGEMVPLNRFDVSQAMNKLFDNFESYSENAYELASKYLISKKWINLEPL